MVRQVHSSSKIEDRSLVFKVKNVWKFGVRSRLGWHLTWPLTSRKQHLEIKIICITWNKMVSFSQDLLGYFKNTRSLFLSFFVRASTVASDKAKHDYKHPCYHIVTFFLFAFFFFTKETITHWIIHHIYTELSSEVCRHLSSADLNSTALGFQQVVHHLAVPSGYYQGFPPDTPLCEDMHIRASRQLYIVGYESQRKDCDEIWSGPESRISITIYVKFSLSRSLTPNTECQVQDLGSLFTHLKNVCSGHKNNLSQKKRVAVTVRKSTENKPNAIKESC